MSRSNLGGAVIAIAFIAAIIFIGVAVHELSYASGHPYAYGPAKVIAWGAGAGVLTCVAVTLIGFSMTRNQSRLNEQAVNPVSAGAKIRDPIG